MTGTRQIKAAFWAIDIVLVAATAFFVVSGTMHLSESSSLANIAPPPLVDSDSPKTAGEQSKIGPRGEFQHLANSNLFGEQSRANVPPPVIDEVLPETTLDLELLGVVVEAGDTPGFAVIRHSKQRGVDTYTVGDFIVGGVRVVEIHEREVVIKRWDGLGGKLETLSLLFSGKKAGSAGRGGFPGARAPIRPKPPRTRQASSREAISVINKNLRRIDRAKLMEEAGQNLASLMDQFRTSPNVVDGKPSGISIDQIGSDPISYKIGILSGDIIKSINGKRINSIDNIFEEGERLQNAPEIRVVIERNGRHRTLVYKIR